MHLQNTQDPKSKPNLGAIAACMDAMAQQMDLSADTLRDSALYGKVGSNLGTTVTNMRERASRIREITVAFRQSGNVSEFNLACSLAGWRPNQHSLESFNVLH